MEAEASEVYARTQQFYESLASRILGPLFLLFPPLSASPNFEQEGTGRTEGEEIFEILCSGESVIGPTFQGVSATLEWFGGVVRIF